MISPVLKIPGRIAVVSSSKEVLQCNGSEIDSYDYVVRFNKAPTKGWEENLGSKTSLRVVNPGVFNNNLHEEIVTGKLLY